MWCSLTPGRLRHLEAVLGVDRRVVLVEDVHARAVERVVRHLVADLVAGVALDAAVHPVGLRRRVVRQLVLVQDGRAVVAVPDGVVPLEVLDEQAGRRHVVAVDDGAVAAGVGVPALGVGEALDAVVAAPHPGVVDEHVVAVDLERDVGLADVRAADAEVHVGQRGRVARQAQAEAVLAADPQQDRRLLEPRVDRDTGDDDAGHVGDVERGRAVDRGQRGVPEAEDHGVGAPDLDAARDVVHARGEQQVLAAARAGG